MNKNPSVNKVQILVEDPHISPEFKRYRKGDVAEVLEYKSRLAGSRQWNYKLRVAETTTDSGRGLSRIIYLKTKEVKKL